jgi:hypothetical protein
MGFSMELIPLLRLRLSLCLVDSEHVEPVGTT